uniref:Uncharacterized protein n=1 Tax=Plectus sambesii TaxID=2011161 RepID=A0A914VWT0_9BILA
MSLLSCCRSSASSKHDPDDYNYYSTAPCPNPKRTSKPKSNVVASSESLGPPKSTNFSAYFESKDNQERKTPRAVAFTINAGSTESTVNASSDLYNRTDDPVTVEQWMNIYEDAKNQAQPQNGSQLQLSAQSSSVASTTASSSAISTAASSTYMGSNERLTIGESGTSIDKDDDDDGDGQSSGRRLHAMQSLGVLPTQAVTLSRQPSHNEPSELEKSHSLAYLTDSAKTAHASKQRSPQLLRCAEVEDIHKQEKQQKFSVLRSPELEDLSHIDTDSE